LIPFGFEGHSSDRLNGWIVSVFDFVLNEDGGQKSHRSVACAYRAAPTRTLEHLRLRLARDK
jgi:hypothetical protein